MMDYFVRKQGNTYGPLKAKAVKLLVAKGKIQPEDLVGNDRDGPWYRAGGITSLESAWRMAADRSPQGVKEADHFVHGRQVASAGFSVELTKRLQQIVAPGVLCQWAPGGVYQFPEAKRVIKFSPDGGFAFFIDSSTGVPVSELEIQQRPRVVPPEGEPEKDATGEGKRDEGAETLSGIVAWLRGVLRAFQQQCITVWRRLVNRKSQAPAAGSANQNQQETLGGPDSRLDSSGSASAGDDHFVQGGQVASAGFSAELTKRLQQIVAPGVLCQWAPDGVHQFPEAKRVIKFSPDGGFAFFIDSSTGVPVRELEIQESPWGGPPGVESDKDATGEGKWNQKAETLSGIVAWLRGVLRAFQQQCIAVWCRLVNRKSQAPATGSVNQNQQRTPGRPDSRLDSFRTVPASEGAIVGIDLGATQSRVAVMQGGSPRVLADLDGDSHLSSIVFYSKNGEVLVGDAAGKQGLTAPERTITSIKRILGKPVEEVVAVRGAADYSITGDKSGNAQVVISGTAYSPEKIASEILAHLKETAELELRAPVSRAVVAVPAHFTNQQRNAMRIACELVGLKVERLINEPTAAALSFVNSYYSKPGRRKSSQRILVFDLGGGSCDVSILETDAKVAMVIATHGDTSLGGDDCREALVNYVTRQFMFESGVDLRQQAGVMPRIREACERVKVDLSYADKAVVDVPFVTGGSDQPLHMQVEVTRSVYEYEIRRLVQRCHGIIGKTLRDSGLGSGDIDEILLVGGMTQTPRIRQMIGEYFDKKPCSTINPREAVVAGAAVQAGILDGVTLDTLLLDVTPFTLAIETEGGLATPLVAKNSSIPLERRSVFSTAEDNQASVTVKVFEGENETAEENRLLGEFDLEGIPLAKRGVPQIEVVFDIDANGILSVGAKELGTGKEMVVRMT